MADHYYTSVPTSVHDERAFSAEICAKALTFITDAGTFSRGHVDPGSQLLIESLPPLCGRVADIGCGWGALGLFIATLNPDCRVEMVDVNQRAVELANRNAQANGLHNASAQCSDGLCALAPGLSFAVTNPPIRAGKAVVHAFFDQAHEKLAPGGKLYVVIR